MKITKNQLRRIIKEEKAKLLNEDNYDPMADAEDSSFGGLNRERQPGDPKTYSSAAAIKQLEAGIMAVLEVMPRSEVAEELREYAKDVAMNRPLGS